MRLSDAGAQLIAELEGFRPNLYNDAGNNCTIGFGTLVHKGCINGSESDEFRRGISRERALEMLGQASNRFAHPYPGAVLSQARYKQTHQPDPNVALIQQALGKLGFPLACDGRFGPATEAAVKQCQQQRASRLTARSAR